MTQRFYDEAAGNMHRGYVNKKGASHVEPIFKNNMLLPKFTAAWMKLYLVGIKSEQGYDWEQLIYGSDEESLCGGGDGDMIDCEVH